MTAEHLQSRRPGMPGRLADGARLRGRSFPRTAEGAYEKNLELVARVRVLAEARGVTAAQLALAWGMKWGGDAVPIPGTKRRKYLEENAAGVAVSLAPGDMAALEAAIAPAEVAGARYSEMAMRAIGR